MKIKLHIPKNLHEPFARLMKLIPGSYRNDKYVHQTILERIKEGESFNMKYYSSVLESPIELKTKIDYLTKEKNGRFKNHYLVGLKILPDQR